MKIELNDQQMQVINQALEQLPYNIAAPIIEHISRQRQSQENSLVILGNCHGQSILGDHIQCRNLIATSDQRLMGAQ